MKRMLRWTISLAGLALLLVPASGCRKEEPKSIDEVRQDRQGSWQKKWAEDRGVDGREAETPADTPPESKEAAPAAESAQPWTAGPDDMSSDEDAEAAEERQQSREAAEADRQMPGKYK